MDKVVEKYSLALLSLANEEGKFEEYRKQVKELLEVFEENDELSQFLANLIVGKDEKKDLVDKVFKGKVDQNIVNFLKVIINKNRGNYIIKILRDFDKCANKQLGIKIGTVYSVTPLDKKQLKEIERVVGKNLDKEVSLRNKIDTSLIAGVKVIVEDKIFDNSINYQLTELKQNLLRKVGEQE